MTIGIYFECQKKSGGVYQFALNLLSILKTLTDKKFIVFNISPDFPFEEYDLPNWRVVNLIPIQSNTVRVAGENISPKNSTLTIYALRRRLNLFIINLLRHLGLFGIETYLARLNSKKRSEIFSKYNLDLIFFHGPSELSLTTKVPYVLPVHDLQHKINTRFPEVSQKGQYEKREHIINGIKKTAYKIIVPTDISKKDLIEMYDIDPAKIIVNHPFPVNYITDRISEEEKILLREKYSLPKKFLFYPAQFWPHKNHINLLRAIKKLRDESINIPLVLVGSEQEIWGEFDRLKQFTNDNSLDNLVHFLGYVNNPDVNILYHTAEALVMPTYLGPIQFPVIEAWKAGCPVICSRARGSEQEMRESVLFFNPDNPEDIADKISQIWNNPQLRSQLITKGLEKSKDWSREHYREVLVNIVNDFDVTLYKQK